MSLTHCWQITFILCIAKLPNRSAHRLALILNHAFCIGSELLMEALGVFELILLTIKADRCHASNSAPLFYFQGV